MTTTFRIIVVDNSGSMSRHADRARAHIARYPDAVVLVAGEKVTLLDDPTFDATFEMIGTALEFAVGDLADRTGADHIDVDVITDGHIVWNMERQIALDTLANVRSHIDVRWIYCNPRR